MTEGLAGTNGQAYHFLLTPETMHAEARQTGQAGVWISPRRVLAVSVNCLVCLFTLPELVTSKDQMGQVVQREPAWLRALM